MIGLVHSSPTTLNLIGSQSRSVLSSPDRYYLNVDVWPWAADNGAFSDFSAFKFSRMVDDLEGIAGCLFLNVPDVVADAEATLASFHHWYPFLAGRGFPLAFALQDGATTDLVPWDAIDALFIGGSTEWKLSDENRELVYEGRERGVRWVHMGRVNGHRRIRFAKAIGCDSFDGTSLSWFRDMYLAEYLEHAGDGHVQMMLDGRRP